MQKLIKLAGIKVVKPEVGGMYEEYIEKYKPTIVVVRGDRIEQLEVAVAAIKQNKLLAHIEGGAISSTRDEIYRHAITKLSHLHFTDTISAQTRVLQMGENPKYVYNVGSLDVELAHETKTQNLIGKPYIVLLQHEIPGEYGSYDMILAVLERQFPEYVIVQIKSNSDYGVSTGIESYSQEDFISLLTYATVVVGNSSAFIKECSVLGTPAVLVGSRQAGRMLPLHVMEAKLTPQSVFFAVKQQIQHGKFEPSFSYFQENTAKQIAEILLNTDVKFQKQWYENKNSR